MQIEIDPQNNNALYIKVNPELQVAITEEVLVEKNVLILVDRDINGDIVGVEVLTGQPIPK